MDKVIILGAGFLGQTFKQYGYDVWGKESPFSHQLPDGTYEYNYDNLLDFNTIINCIGKSNTKWCEKRENFSSALESNYYLPQRLSQFCEKNNRKFVHISTGCLYDRNDIPQTELSFTAAHCNYTITKWAGERGCNPNRDLILRPRLYFGSSKNPNNLLCKLPNFPYLTNSLDSLTSVDTIVNAAEALLKANVDGVVNVACTGYTSMYEIGKLLGLDKRACSQDTVRFQNNIYLVNNTMDLTKLQKYYNPPKIEEEIVRCWKRMNETNTI